MSTDPNRLTPLTLEAIHRAQQRGYLDADGVQRALQGAVRRGAMHGYEVDDLLLALGVSGCRERAVAEELLPPGTFQPFYDKPKRSTKQCYGFDGLLLPDALDLLVTLRRLGLPIERAPVELVAEAVMAGLGSRTLITSAELQAVWLCQWDRMDHGLVLHAIGEVEGVTPGKIVTSTGYTATYEHAAYVGEKGMRTVLRMSAKPKRVVQRETAAREAA